MASSGRNVERILHFRLRSPAVDAAQLAALMKNTLPFYRAMGVERVQLLRNVDDPTHFIQVIHYRTPEALEVNRQRIASDAMFRTYLQTWRTMFAGAVEIDVFEDVTGEAASSK